MLEPGRSEPVGADADILHKMGPAVKGAGPPVTRDDKRGAFPPSFSSTRFGSAS